MPNTWANWRVTSVFAHPRGASEQKTTDGPIRVPQT